MPTRSFLVGLAAATLLIAPAAAHAGVTDVSISQSGNATVGTTGTATFTANASDGANAPFLPIYYFAADCNNESDPSGYGGGSIDSTYVPTFTTPGQHNVCAYVTSQGQAAWDKKSVDVTEADSGPVAKLVLSATSVAVGGSITLDASTSVNAVPGALNYTFDVDGDQSDGYEVDNGTNPIYTATFPNAASNRQVGVRVIDRNHLASSATALVDIVAPAGAPGTPTGPVIIPPSPLVDGPLGNITFTVEPFTINQFLVSGIVTKFQWGDVNAKAAIKVYLVTSKKVRGRKKTSKLLITAPFDNVYYAYGSGFTREAKGSAAKALRKLKSAKIEVDWTVTSKKGDTKTGVYTTTIKKGL